MALHEFQNSLEKFVGTMESCHEERELLLQQLAEVSDEIHAVRAAVFALARSRAATAARARELGVTLKELAAVMGVTPARAGQISDKDQEEVHI